MVGVFGIALLVGLAIASAVRQSADPERLTKVDSVRDEWLSRLGPEQREAAEDAPAEADVPADTYAYVSEESAGALADRCRKTLREGRADTLCELIVLHDEGKIEAGPYSVAEVKAVLSR